MNLFMCRSKVETMLLSHIKMFTNNIPRKIGSWVHPFSTYTKFSEKLTFLAPWYARPRVGISGSEMLVFRKILRTYLMDDLLKHIIIILRFDINEEVSTFQKQLQLLTLQKQITGFVHSMWGTWNVVLRKVYCCASQSLNHRFYDIRFRRRYVSKVCLNFYDCTFNKSFGKHMQISLNHHF